jgi:tight adherence protein C
MNSIPTIAPAWIALLAGSALFMAFLGTRNLLVTRQRVSQRMQAISRKPGNVLRLERAQIAEDDLPLLWRAVAFLGWAMPHLMTSEDLEWDLMQAGYRRRGARGVYAGAKVLLAVLGASGLLLLGASLHLAPGQPLLLALGAGIVGLFTPNLWVAYRQSVRREEIRLALPDALDLMVICVEAGQGLNAAILKVGREVERHSPVLSEELQLLNQEVRVGLDRSQALRNFALRTGVEEARALAAVLIQSDRLGTSIAKALRVHAQSLRTRRRQRAEEAARKTAVKLVFPLVLCIFPELLVVILAPAMIQLVRTLGDSASH